MIELYYWPTPNGRKITIRAALSANNKALPDINGDESRELPLPATYVIAPDSTIIHAAIELDYRERLDPDIVIGVLSGLSDGKDSAA